MNTIKVIFSFIRMLITLAIFDRLLELIYKPILHRNRKGFIQDTLNQFKLHTTDANVISAFEKKLQKEAVRVYAMIDESILIERIIRSRYLFFATAISITILVGALGGFEGGTIIPFISPLAMAAVAWAGSIFTIPVSYDQRVIGAMKSSLASQLEELKEAANTSTRQITESLAASPAALAAAVPQATTAPAVGNLIQLDAVLKLAEEGRMDEPASADTGSVPNTLPRP